MQIPTLVLLFLLATTSFAQQRETFDLATYTIPAGWNNVSKTNSATSYIITNNQTGTYCRIGIFASTVSKGNLQADFQSEWQELVVKMYHPTAKPTLASPESESGWEAQVGAAPFQFNGAQSVAMLVTMSGYGRCLSIVILTNTDEYQPVIEKFLESVDLKKIENNSQPAVDNTDNTSILGTWGKASGATQRYGDPASYGHAGYSKDQYTLNNDGTYFFVSKTFRSSYDKILLVRENGTYQISGNNITINPQKSVLESWSKKDGTDKWGKLLTTQNRALEKVTYRFTKHYFSGIQVWNLVLQSDIVTERDGPFSTNTTFTNAWYYGPITSNNPVIELPAEQQQNNVPPKKETSSPAATDGFTFGTTNFDDGWTSSVQAEWVEVVKGRVKVLIHYPNKQADTYNSVLLDGLKNAWNILVAPKYSAASNIEFKPINGWQTIEFAEADAVEHATGKTVHVVLFKMNYSNGSGKYLEFITPDKQSFEQEYGAYHEDTYGWEKMESMANYNKFAVAAADLKGKWTNDFSGALQYVNAYTGADAGMATHASNEKFEFGPGNNYKWDIGVASGFVGSIKFQSAKSNGKFSLPNNWQIIFSDIEGKPRTYNTYFSCVKGARILWLDNTGYGRVD
jgi:hypothetical protein